MSGIPPSRATPPAGDERTASDAATSAAQDAPSQNSGPQDVISSKNAPAVLERDVSLSESLIWRLQQQFYAQRGLKAWTEDQVPAYITNNPFIAEIYARIVFGFLRDCIASSGNGAQPLSPANPLRILELGAGTGRFSFLFLRQLMEVLHAQGIAAETVRYCMADCSQALLEAWRANGCLAEFVAAGVLEFELLQAGGETQSPFARGERRGATTRACGPLVLIANYVFDSLAQDAFVVQDGKILEVLVTTTSKHSGAIEDPANTLADLELSFRNAAAPAGRYAEPAWNAILEDYCRELPAATVLFPSQALRTLQALGKLTDNRMLVLAADKGYAYQDQLLLSQGPPTLEFHAPNCFSQMVNFDAIARHFQASGGHALLPDKHSTGLNICAFLQGRQGDAFAAARSAYCEAQSGFGPDDLFTLLAWLNAHMEEMTVPQVLATMRLTRWDPTALMRLFPVLARQLNTVTRERSDIRDAVLRVWANHFPIAAADKALAFQCGVILLELRYFDDAASMFRASQKILGASAATSYNLGLCELGLGKAAEALSFMVEACNLDPQFEPARLTRRKLENENAR